MKADMPVRFWGTLPEAESIPQLLQKGGHSSDAND
jgi:hypothetical protein